MTTSYPPESSDEASALLACAQQWLSSLGWTDWFAEAPEVVEGPSASLRIEGTKAWVVQVCASERVLRRAAEELTGVSTEDVDDELLQDMVRELVNTLGGNLYPSLEGATKIGLPCAGVPGGTEVARVRLGDGRRSSLWVQLRSVSSAL